MAMYSKKDIADITFNSTDLKAYVTSVSGLKLSSVISEYRAPGAAYHTRTATGMYDTDPVVVDFMYDDGASGPNVKCAQDTSSTLTITFVSGQSVTGTALVTEREVTVPDDDDLHLVVTFLWSAAAGPTWDTAA